jgi:hypothetical protein
MIHYLDTKLLNIHQQISNHATDHYHLDKFFLEDKAFQIYTVVMCCFLYRLHIDLNRPLSVFVLIAVFLIGCAIGHSRLISSERIHFYRTGTYRQRIFNFQFQRCVALVTFACLLMLCVMYVYPIGLILSVCGILYVYFMAVTPKRPQPKTRQLKLAKVLAWPLL